ncbi:MAG: hypothetical protein ABW095_16700 [Candidatus Thiodiazotropha sp.]
MDSSNDPYTTPSSDIQGELNTIRIPFFKSWAIILVLATLGGFVAGFVAGAIVGALMSSLSATKESIEITGGFIGFIIGLPISYYAFRWSVSKFIVSKLVRDSD